MKSLLYPLVFLLMISCSNSVTNEESDVADTLIDITWQDISKEQAKTVNKFWNRYQNALLEKNIEYIGQHAEFPLEGSWNTVYGTKDTSNTKANFKLEYPKLFTSRLVDSVSSATGHRITGLQQNQFGEIKEFRITFYFEDHDELDDFIYESAIILEFKKRDNDFVLVGYFFAG